MVAHTAVFRIPEFVAGKGTRGLTVTGRGQFWNCTISCPTCQNRDWHHARVLRPARIFARQVDRHLKNMRPVVDGYRAGLATFWPVDRVLPGSQQVDLSGALPWMATAAPT